MMANGKNGNDDDSHERTKFSLVYIWIPLAVTVFISLLLIGFKLAEKVKNSFTSWGWIIAFIIITALVTFGLSIGVYLILSIKTKKKTDREFNGRQFCHEAIKNEVRNRTGYNVNDFTETSDSVEGVGYFGKQGQDLIYYHLFRIQKGQFNRYLLGVMNMEKGKEDLVILRQCPMNFDNLNGLITDTCNMLSQDQVKYQENETVFQDSVTGRSEVRKSRSPMVDKDKNDEDEDEE